MREALLVVGLLGPVAWILVAPRIYSSRRWMRSPRRLAARSLLYDAMAWTLGVVAATQVRGVDGPLELSAPIAVCVGAAVGGLLFCLFLNREEARALSTARATRRLRLSAAILCATAVSEELFWRGLVQDTSARILGAGTVGALALTTVMFALLHQPAYGWRGVPTHVLTGLVFGGLFAATGALVAPVAAHVAYNLGVATLKEALRAPPPSRRQAAAIPSSYGAGPR